MSDRSPERLRIRSAFSVSQGVEVLIEDGAVRLETYWLTATLLKARLKELNIEFKCLAVNKWEFVFIATNRQEETTTNDVR